MKNKLIRLSILFVFYGVVYFLIECIYKQKITSPWMFLFGAVAGIFIGEINEVFSYETDLFDQGVIGSIFITLLELFGGMVINRDLSIWNYSNLTDFHGLICVEFSLLWILVSMIAVIIDDAIRYYIFKEDDEIPHYHFFSIQFSLSKRK